MRKYRSLAATLGLICLMGTWVGPAQAGLIVSLGNDPQVDDNVISSSTCANHIDGPSLMVEGCLNGSHSTLVQFTSDENITYAAGGQAKVNDGILNGAYSELSIEVVSQSFQTLILNIDANADGWISFTDGTTVSSLLALDANGSNFFTITGGTFPYISFTTYDASGQVETDLVTQTSQVRIGIAGITDECVTNPDLCVTRIPEPGTLPVMVIGLASLAGLFAFARWQVRSRI